MGKAAYFFQDEEASESGNEAIKADHEAGKEIGICVPEWGVEDRKMIGWSGECSSNHWTSKFGMELGSSSQSKARLYAPNRESKRPIERQVRKAAGCIAVICDLAHNGLKHPDVPVE